MEIVANAGTAVSAGRCGTWQAVGAGGGASESFPKVRAADQARNGALFREKDLTVSLRLRPESTSALGRRARAWHSLREFDRAIAANTANTSCATGIPLSLSIAIAARLLEGHPDADQGTSCDGGPQ